MMEGLAGILGGGQAGLLQLAMKASGINPISALLGSGLDFWEEQEEKKREFDEYYGQSGAWATNRNHRAL